MSLLTLQANTFYNKESAVTTTRLAAKQGIYLDVQPVYRSRCREWKVTFCTFAGPAPVHSVQETYASGKRV
ncbi:hypothetical protein KNP414_05975 [Paenibacillus mucilaginosus KNP414]|uniref:Uncharacterized protein n=1 Tax=Paenibacillus mucilaginosus (strain KNP414) TaxID=1036673 RepID=F8FC98_PAEMK|nr:hypothetical protein KNP414_05975 [Paenibacillus mucilaginosus KNP414]